MQLDTISTRFGIIAAANVTTNGFTTQVPTITSPTGTIQFGSDDGGIASNGLLLVPYGVGSNTNTFLMNVIGWREVVGPVYQAGTSKLWIPVVLATFTGCTLDSALPGVVNSDLGTTQYFCNAMTLGTGNSGISVEVVSPASGDYIAHAVVDVKGFRKVGVYFSTGGSATSCNALWAKL